MKRYIFSLLFTTLYSAGHLLAQLPPVCNQLKCPSAIEEMTPEQIDKWMERLLEDTESTGELSIDAEVTAKWKNVHEQLNGIKQVGIDSASGRANNQYGIQANLLFDYSKDKTWAQIKLEFDNSAGRNTGSVDAIALKRANMGYHILQDAPVFIDVLVGRAQMSDLYYSEVEFDGVSDGVTLTLRSDIEGFTDFVTKGGIYLYDAKTSHAFWVVDVGFYNFANTGLYFEYNLIDWSKDSRSGYQGAPNNRFLISQANVGWNSNPDLIPIPVKVFSGFLWNHRAYKGHYTHYQTENFAFYAGLQMGKVKKQYDWAFKAQWQSVQAEAIPDFDVSGIGRGNAIKGALYSNNNGPLRTGNTNYQGFEISGIFALTDNISLKPKFQRSVALNTSINTFSYTRFGVDALYTY